MPFDAGLAQRIEELVEDRFGTLAGLLPKKMFGGICYVLHGNMCFGIHKDTLIVRVGEPVAATLLRERHVGPMNLTGKVMKGWVTVQPKAMSEDQDLERFCRHAIDFVGKLPAK
jgi:TfoX/Sxy family transcriptional regulator of competence genes